MKKLPSFRRNIIVRPSSTMQNEDDYNLINNTRLFQQNNYTHALHGKLGLTGRAAACSVRVAVLLYTYIGNGTLA
ncbi:hypothetical protein E2C01_069933 [Portunus trituberculatus]|uniref:Uncharacterized protein n=1 Tax=Portunus trituberculatus TaxID=210409 RepID=A0A5B7HZW8_PORTR|nr:hypothetical protein [Portunus trituberculatus]